MKYKQVTFGLTIMLALAGIWAIYSMPRMEDPRITIRQGLVLAAYPGANELEVENQVTKRLEQQLFSYKEVRKEKTYSTTKAGAVVVNVTLQDWVTDTDKFWAKLQDGLNSSRQALPPGCAGAVRERRVWRRGGPDDCRNGEGPPLRRPEAVPRPARRCHQNAAAGVENPALRRAARAGLCNDFGRPAAAVRAGLRSDWAGPARPEQRALLRRAGPAQRPTCRCSPKGCTARRRRWPTRLVYSDPATGSQVRLRDVAKLERRDEELASRIKIDGQSAVMLTVEMQPGNNMVWFGDKLDARIKEVEAKFPAGVKVQEIVSQPKVVDHKLKDFLPRTVALPWPR